MNTHRTFRIATTLVIGLWATGCAHNSATPGNPYFTGYHKADGAGLTAGVVDRAAIAEALPKPERGGSEAVDVSDDWALEQYYMDRYMRHYPNRFAINSYWSYNNRGYNRYRMRLHYGNQPAYWGYDSYWGYDPFYDPFYFSQSPWSHSSYPYHFYPYDQPLNYYGYSGYYGSRYSNYGYIPWGGSVVTQSGERKLRRPRDRDGGQRTDKLIPSFGGLASTIPANTARPVTGSKPVARPKKERESTKPLVSTRNTGRKKGTIITKGSSSKPASKPASRPAVKPASKPKSAPAKKPSSSRKKSRPKKRNNG